MTLYTTAKRQYAHREDCAQYWQAEKAGNAVEVTEEYALSALIPCSFCFSESERELFAKVRAYRVGADAL